MLDPVSQVCANDSGLTMAEALTRGWALEFLDLHLGRTVVRDALTVFPIGDNPESGVDTAHDHALGIKAELVILSGTSPDLDIWESNVTCTVTQREGAVTNRSTWVKGWSQQAACIKAEPDALFARGAAQQTAKQVCIRCPVIAECLADSLDNHTEFGVWGGMTERQRRALLKRRPDVVSWRALFEADRTRGQLHTS
jgi:WhiB family redox-sensing transcriptional regulator